MEGAESRGQGLSVWQAFAIKLSAVILLFLAALFAALYLNYHRAIETEYRNRARAIFNSIVLTRAWNASYGGVYVEKKPGDASNPYLKNPEFTATDGKVYTKKNPALMTREISAIASRRGDFQFHMTSLRPINPGNTPDAFERRALESFAAGEREAMVRESRDGQPYFRYMAPLFVEQPCLACHAEQGYKLGDIRGGISVAFSIEAAETSLRRDLWIAAGLFGLTSALFLGVVFRFVLSLHRRLAVAEARIRELAVTDELTGLRNRRYVLERLAGEFARARRRDRPLSCVLIDVDHFKGINDRYGHDGGDVALRAVSATLARQSRQTDILGRYGGEEFILFLPETDAGAAGLVAERIRQAVAATEVVLPGGQKLSLTASFGVASFVLGEPRIDDAQSLIKYADRALYRAKAAGRNRVEQGDCDRMPEDTG